MMEQCIKIFGYFYAFVLIILYIEIFLFVYIICKV